MLNLKPSEKVMPKHLIYPRIKVKHVKCIFCSANFFLSDHQHLKKKLPVLLACGHTICDLCARTQSKKWCAGCDPAGPVLSLTGAGNNTETSFSLNIYLHGMVYLYKTKPPTYVTSIKDDVFKFKKSLTAQINDAEAAVVADVCNECNSFATSQCLGCNDAFFCSDCFNQVHQHNINKNHERIMVNPPKTNLGSRSITCSEHSTHRLKQWCIECKKACCEKCVTLNHSSHNLVLLYLMNQTLQEKLEDVYGRVREMLVEVYASQKKVRTILKAEENHKTEDIEANINKSFIYLHSVLQLIEEKMIQTMYEKSHKTRVQVEEIDENLKNLKERLESAVVTALFAKKHSENVSHRTIISDFEQLLKFPCHFIEPSIASEESNFTFKINTQEIIESMQKHCEITASPVADSYQLVCIDEIQNGRVPDNPTNLSGVPQHLFDKPEAVKSPELTPPPSVASDFTERQSPTLQSESENSAVESESSMMYSAASSVKSGRVTEKHIKSGVDVTVTHIESPNCFYTRAKIHDADFKELEKKLEKYNQVNTRVPKEVLEGHLYVINRNENPKWYRGRIQGSKSADGPCFYPEYEVFAIDYGFTDSEVHKANIRNLFEDLLDIPPLVQKYSLHDISPRGETWTSEAVVHMDELLELAISPPRLYTTPQDGKDLFIHHNSTELPISMRDSLIFEGLGTFISTARLFRINPSASNAFHHECLSTDKYYDAVFLNSYKPDCIYVRKASYNEVYYQNMVQKMTEDYISSKRIKGYIYCPRAGMHVAVPHEQSWYRGIIVDIAGIKKVQVLLVDLGVNITVDYKRIRRLDSRYTQSTVRAIKLSLKDVKPFDSAKDWSPEANKAIRHFMNPPDIRIVIYSSESIDGFPQHTASVVNKKRVSLSLYLEFLKISARTASPGVLEKMESRFRSIQSKEMQSGTKKRRKTGKKMKQEPSVLDDPYKVQVSISFVKSPDEIYVSRVHDSTTIDDIGKKMREFYEINTTEEEVELLEDTICAVFFKNFYYRAKIMKVQSPAEVIVFLIDRGETHQVPAADLLNLADEFYEIPICAFKVKLAGIIPCGGSKFWPTVSIQSLEELLEQNGNFFISKVAESENDAMVVDIFCEQSIVDNPVAPARSEICTINRELINRGFALPIKGFSDRKLKVLASEIHEEMMASSCDLSRSGISTDFSDESEYEDEETDDEDDIESQISDKTVKLDKDEEEEEDPEFADVPFSNSAAFPQGIPQWLPAEAIDPSKPFIAKITDVDWDGYLHLHSVEKSSPLIASIEKTLNDKFNGSSAREETWSEGEMCIAKYQDTWSRAVVHRVKKKIAVQYVDYGNLFWQDARFLRKKIYLADIPQQATRCKVYEMVPDTPNKVWRQGDLTKLHALLVDRICWVRIVTQSPEVLVKIELQEHGCDLLTYLKENNILKLQNLFAEEMDNLKKRGYKIDYGVKLIESGDDVYDSNSEDSPDVIIENEDMTDIDLDLMENDAVDLENKNEIKNGNGNRSEHEVENESENEDDLGLLNGDLIPFESYHMSDCYPVFTLPAEVKSFEALMGHVDTSRPNIIYLHPIASKDHGALEFFKIEYDKMMEKIRHQVYDCPDMQSFGIGKPCLAKYSKDQAWYRCIILTNPDSDGLIKVEFVDWGTIDWVFVNEIRPVNQEWMKLPKMAIKCRLWNTRTTNSSLDAVEWLHRSSKEVRLDARVEKYEDGCVVVKLYTKSHPDKLFYQSLIDRRIFQAELNDLYK